MSKLNPADCSMTPGQAEPDISLEDISTVKETGGAELPPEPIVDWGHRLTERSVLKPNPPVYVPVAAVLVQPGVLMKTEFGDKQMPDFPTVHWLEDPIDGMTLYKQVV